MAVAKIKISSFAKDLGVDKNEVMELLTKFGSKAKTTSSSISNNELDIILEYFTQKHQVEEFDFILKKLDEKPKKEKKKEEVPTNEEAETTTISKKEKHYVDTRKSNVDLDKYDTEKIEELVPDNIKSDNLAGGKQKIKKGKKNEKFDKEEIKVNKEKKQKAEKITVAIGDEISVGDFAEKLGRPAAEVVKCLMMIGVMASVSQTIDFDTAALIATEFNAEVEKEVIITDEDILFNDVEDKEEDLVDRSPVVVVMGHVDHGKTKLLDSIRKTNVIDTEAGGITQHIGAYRVRINDRDITFLDTPGHEAFTSMRARGAQVTDVAILVVAADDGIMPQTVEAINHAKAANINIIVAINKIDKETANPDLVKQQLTEYGLVPEEWGGDTICVPISALKGENVDTLLEMVLLVADMKELKANPNRLAKGTVIEAKLDKGRGPVATVLVQNGTLKTGDIVVAGTAVGKVRAMTDDKGRKVKTAGPCVPVELIGLSETPEGGDLFYVVTDERKAREVVENRKQKIKEEYNKSTQQVISLDALFDQIEQGQIKDLNIIVKADVQGSVEAVTQSLVKLSNDEVRINVIHGAVGTVNESDIMLASASNAIIVGFNVRPSAATMDSAALKNVEIRLYRIIYQAIEEIEAAMKGMLEPTYRENVIGHAEIRQTFKVSGVGTIAGCYVTDGKIQRNSEVRIVRDGIVIHESMLNSLKRFKDDVKEVASGYECGLGVERYNDIKEGDVIECFIMEEVPR
ncbi:MAG: translation initiation factor IF-2 [Clostridia bacterium]|nr:translation initiation factor IF-2 [Clostridia bacterium]